MYITAFASISSLSLKIEAILFAIDRIDSERKPKEHTRKT